MQSTIELGLGIAGLALPSTDQRRATKGSCKDTFTGPTALSELGVTRFYQSLKGIC